jgi:hypothetical protein
MGDRRVCPRCRGGWDAESCVSHLTCDDCRRRARDSWLSLLDSPPTAVGWYWAWDGTPGRQPVPMQWTGPGWVYVGRLGGTLEQVAWSYPWWWPAAISPPATEATA